MSRSRLGRAWLIVPILAVLGSLVGVVLANVLTGREDRFTAQATLAMLPDRDIPLQEVSSFWEVLNRGQATGSAAIVLSDNIWLAGAASAAGVPKSELTLSAGAIPDTTLITVTMKARSARVAEVALDSVLTDGVGPAAAVSGPFRLETVASPNGSARAMGPAPIQMLGALGVAGLLAGSGAGLILGRSLKERSVRRSDHAVESRHAAGDRPVNSHNGVRQASGQPISVEIPPQWR